MTALATPPLTPKSVATRKLLLDLAADMFIEHGYAAISLRDIADAAGLTKGAIYGHFRSKGQLLVEVIRSELAQRDSLFDLDEAAQDPDTLFDLFISPGSRELRLLQTDAAAAARHDPDVADGVEEVFAERTRWILDTLSEYADPDTVVFVINALSSGIGVQEAHGRDVPDVEVWRKTLSAMFEALSRLPTKDPNQGDT
ncbi:MAG: TetR family transcriptional regulator [Acidimicrobiaceae bacterium]|nr:TetR family transcriptional regulator [Acidimicrobiaceae bacterium]MYD06157.1 TetR family transcriptional regulator [Acidimicrobiaceae bacterium]MYI57403.1 TetR family transcriptional regulator [Acidimicrobiaceae bacterium]